ncbi:uncharacterized protein BX663DRAFT_507525 [Cokeromyces recurvatus]|uniref:uncharacterized protein n=1 Tax=Cokeromyces recurvatus TaxID=90255 RepID=UPI00221FAFDB|nr:uncharacterized protein BX663DRAFT_507525 [Cokeromyces recurvatus]KAI7903772.1 hypothetical protein BX663DRAFT_507525 [Cokeromyces recurvatus]
MPVYKMKENSLLDRVNKEKNLICFMDTPITYKKYINKYKNKLVIIHILMRTDIYIYKRKDFDLVIDYYHVDDLPDQLREWTFQLVKSNLYDM